MVLEQLLSSIFNDCYCNFDSDCNNDSNSDYDNYTIAQGQAKSSKVTACNV